MKKYFSILFLFGVVFVCHSQEPRSYCGNIVPGRGFENRFLISTMESSINKCTKLLSKPVPNAATRAFADDMVFIEDKNDISEGIILKVSDGRVVASGLSCYFDNEGAAIQWLANFAWYLSVPRWGWGRRSDLSDRLNTTIYQQSRSKVYALMDESPERDENGLFIVIVFFTDDLMSLIL